MDYSMAIEGLYFLDSKAAQSSAESAA
jgi:hypothetical protein